MSKINYDKISELYDSVRSGDPEVIAYILENKLLGHESKVLEIGCGSGNNTVLMAAATEAEVHGLDQSRGMLGKAEKKSERIHFIQGDAVTLEGIKERFGTLDCFKYQQSRSKQTIRKREAKI